MPIDPSSKEMAPCSRAASSASSLGAHRSSASWSASGPAIYQAGVAQGIVDAGRFPAGATVPVAGYGWHRASTSSGCLFGLFFLFLLFGIIRAAFSGGRGWGRGWGHHGYGPGWGKSASGEGGPDSWRERARQPHRRAGTAGSTSEDGDGRHVRPQPRAVAERLAAPLTRRNRRDLARPTNRSPAAVPPRRSAGGIPVSAPH